MTKKVITFANGSKHTVYYEAKDDNNVIRFEVPDLVNENKKRIITSHSKTDSFGRKVFDELQLGTGFVSREFSYCTGAVTQEHIEHEKGKSSPTTQLVSRIAISDGSTFSYEYDDEERIIKVTDALDGTVSYTYDALGQLLTETVNGADVNSMEYDNYGNDTKSMFIINLIAIVLYNFFAALLMGCGVFYSLHTSMTIRAELRRSQARMQTVPSRKKPYTLTMSSSKSKSRNTTQ